MAQRLVFFVLLVSFGLSGSLSATPPIPNELIAKIEALEAKDPQSPALPALYVELGRALKKPEEMPDAENVFFKGRQLFETHLQKTPNDTVLATGYRACLEQQAELEIRMLRWQDAETTIKLGLQFVPKSSPEAEARFRALEMKRLANQLRLSEANELTSSITLLWDAARKANPTNKELTKKYTEHLYFSGRLLIQLGHVGQAEKLLRQAVSVAKPLHESAPNDDSLATLHFVCVNELALALRDAGRFVAAEQACLLALKLAQQRSQADPKSHSKAKQVMMVYQNLSNVYSPHMSAQEQNAYRAKAEEQNQQLPTEVVNSEEDMAEGLLRAGSSVFGDQQMMLSDSRAYYERMKLLGQKYPKIPAYVVQRIYAGTLLVAKESKSGNNEEAFRILAESKHTLEELLQSQPRVPLYEYLLLTYDLEWLNYDIQLGKAKEAQARFEQTSESWQKLIDQYPTNTYFAKTFTQLMLISMGYAQQSKDRTLTHKIAHAIHDQHQALVNQAPHEIHFRRLAANMWQVWATLYLEARQWANVEKCLQNGLASWEAITKDYPDVPDFALAQIDMYRSLGQTLDERERYKEALAQFSSGALLAQKWQAAQPTMSFFASRFSGICFFAARTANNAGLTENAIEWMTRATLTNEQLIKQRPNEFHNYEQLREMYKERALMHNRLGKTQQYDADWKKADEIDRTMSQMLTKPETQKMNVIPR